MANVDFTKLLAQTEEQVERPVPLPEGSYEAAIKGFDLGESAEKKTPYVEVSFEILEAKGDVDPAELAKIEKGVTGKKVKRKFYLTAESTFMLWDFFGDVGLTTQGKTTQQLLEESKNNSVGLYITQRIANDGSDRVFAEVKRTFNPQAA